MNGFEKKMKRHEKKLLWIRSFLGRGLTNRVGGAGGDAAGWLRREKIKKLKSQRNLILLFKEKKKCFPVLISK